MKVYSENLHLVNFLIKLCKTLLQEIQFILLLDNLDEFHSESVKKKEKIF
jgi:hypothetical protein